MNEVFTFLGLFGEGHTYLFASHVILAALIVLVLAKTATSSLQIVPKGMQNIMEAYLQGVIAMGTDVIGKRRAKKYLPLVATLGLFIFVSNMMEIIPGFEPPSGKFLDLSHHLVILI